MLRMSMVSMLLVLAGCAAAPKSDPDVKEAITLAILQGIQPCWLLPPDPPDWQDGEIVVTIRLNEDGTLAEQPQLLNKEARMSSEGELWSVARSALRAIELCQPFDDLPSEHYEVWRKIVLTFMRRP